MGNPTSTEQVATSPSGSSSLVGKWRTEAAAHKLRASNLEDDGHSIYSNGEAGKSSAKMQCADELEAALATQTGGAGQDVTDLYHELLYEVVNKYPGESRHETARRYIRERENRPAGVASSALPPVPETKA